MTSGQERRAMEKRCQFWLPGKRRHCSNSPLPHSSFCGNHDPSYGHLRVPCPIDPSHSVLKESLESHAKRCPFAKQARALESKPYFSKGINTSAIDPEDEITTSEAKRKAIYELTPLEFHNLIDKIKFLHSSFCSEIRDSFVISERCSRWMNQSLDRQVPFQEKHAMQQASIIGNMETFGLIGKQLERPAENCGLLEEKTKGKVVAVVEFGAGRGYLAHMLADCYDINKVFLIERRSCKLKADRSLRQKPSLLLERLRIDIEDLDLCAIDSLKEVPYLAVGKHLCGPATDLTIRCCLSSKHNQNRGLPCNSSYLQGFALATCCHHLCQWKHYINTDLFTNLGVTKAIFHAISWFSSWAVDADHSSSLSDTTDHGLHLLASGTDESAAANDKGVEGIIRNMSQMERAVLGFRCKDIIDIGRLLWLADKGFQVQLLKYVPSNISPENHLLVAKYTR